VPWLGLALALTFGFYGLCRKLAKIPSLPGLAFETLALAPIAIAWATDVPTEARTPLVIALLAGAGVATALPLLWFNEAAQRMPLTVLGVLQYLAPTGQFLVGTFVFHEAFSRETLVAFAFIWVGLALYTGDALSGWRPQPRG
jgi:chloramphenicol-sensitive protein RarD